MRRRVLSALLVLAAPVIVAVAGCSSAQDPSPSERIAQHRQRLTGAATKNCQLIGDWDRSHYPRVPTKVPTKSWYAVEGTDLGYPVSDGERLWFFFGDMFASPNDATPDPYDHTAPDPLGLTWDLSLPADGCPEMDFEFDYANDTFVPLTLDGAQLGGFSVPTGAVFDATGDRFITGFMRPTSPGLPPDLGILATAPKSSPTVFTSHVGILNRLGFVLIAPAIVPASQVGAYAELGVTSPDEKVLLVWGAKAFYRNSAVYLAAAPLATMEQPSAWRLLSTSGAWGDPDSAVAAEVFPPEKFVADPAHPQYAYFKDRGCVGEFSVNFNPVFRKWMMMYTCGKESGQFTQGRGTLHGAVYLRTAEAPLGPWSPAIPLFRPKEMGMPADGDDASFVHALNPRIYRTYENGVATWHRLPEDSDAPLVGNATFPPIPAGGCPDPSQFPADCPSAAPQDPDDPTVGCCMYADRCCDQLFEKHSLEGMGSYAGAGIYASYLIQEYSEALDGSGTTPPTHQRLHYLVSTWQPYTVVLMSSELFDDDIDNDGVLNDNDNCQNVYNPKQENCNLEAEKDGIALGRNTKILGDACDPVPCPTGSADRIVSRHLVAGSCTEDLWEASVCIGRSIRNVIDLRPVGSSPTEEVQRAYDFKQPINIPQPNERVDARFCQQRLPDYNCALPSKRRDVEMWRFASDAEESDNPQFIWHRVTLNCGPHPPYTCPTSFLPRGQEYALDYGLDRRGFSWDYRRDSAYWNGAPIGEPANPNGRIIPVPDPVAPCSDASTYGDGTCLDGMFWTHGYWDWGQYTPGGGSVEWAFDGTEWREVGTHGIELSNAFFPAAPDATFAWARGGVRAKPLFWLVFTLPDPLPSWRFFDGSRVPIVFDNREPEAAFDDGHRALASDVFTPEAVSALTDDASGITWVAPVEASPYAGAASRPVGMGIRNRGSGMQVPGSLIWSAGRVAIGPGVTATSAGPPPRTELLTAYSRSRARFFVAGGRDVASGVSLNDVWMLDVVSGAWTQVTPDTSLRELLAITYSYRERVLWILDRGVVEGFMTTRLLRVEPDTGTTQVTLEARQYESAPRYADRYLGTDADGQLVLSVSSSAPQRHQIAVMETKPGTYAVSTTGCRARALATAAVSDLRGYALYYQPETEVDSSCVDVPEAAPRGAPAQRIVELPLSSGTMTTLREMLE